MMRVLPRYAASHFMYAWHLTSGNERPTLFLVAVGWLLLLPVFLTLPSYREQIRSWTPSK